MIPYCLVCDSLYTVLYKSLTQVINLCTDNNAHLINAHHGVHMHPTFYKFTYVSALFTVYPAATHNYRYNRVMNTYPTQHFVAAETQTMLYVRAHMLRLNCMQWQGAAWHVGGLHSLIGSIRPTRPRLQPTGKAGKEPRTVHKLKNVYKWHVYFWYSKSSWVFLADTSADNAYITSSYLHLARLPVGGYSVQHIPIKVHRVHAHDRYCQ